MGLLVIVLMLASPAPSKISCVATKQEVVVYDRETKKTHEESRWQVACSGGEKPLSQTYDSFHDAMVAIARYRGDCVGECDHECQDRCVRKGECPEGWKP